MNDYKINKIIVDMKNETSNTKSISIKLYTTYNVNNLYNFVNEYFGPAVWELENSIIIKLSFLKFSNFFRIIKCSTEFDMRKLLLHELKEVFDNISNKTFLIMLSNNNVMLDIFIDMFLKLDFVEDVKISYNNEFLETIQKPL